MWIIYTDGKGNKTKDNAGISFGCFYYLAEANERKIKFAVLHISTCINRYEINMASCININVFKGAYLSFMKKW